MSRGGEVGVHPRAGATAFRPGGWTDGFVWSLALGQTVSWGVLYYAYPVLLVPMQRDLGWSRTALVGGFTTAIVISGVLAPAVGHRLDNTSPRLLMGAGSVAGVALVVGWSRAATVPAYYATWIAIGVVMALVLYEPAFTVLAKRYTPHHHRAMTTVTLIAGTSSFVFQPLTSALVSRQGWRAALLVLAAVLAAVTLPVHLGVLGVAGGAGQRDLRLRGLGRRRRPDLDGRFWTLTAAFAASSVTSFGTSVLLVAYLVDHGWTLGAAAGAGGTLGVMQLPGRLLLARLRPCMAPGVLTPAMLGLPGAGVVLLLLSGGTWLVWPAVAVLGMSQGINTLLRVTLWVDLYGTDRIGSLNGLSATPITLARAVAPLGAAFVAGATGGYTAPFLLLAGAAVLAAALAAADR